MGLDPRHWHGRHAGQDIYVLGSGPSLNHFADIERMFAGKLIVSCNHGSTMALTRLPDYLVTKYHEHARQYVEWFPGAQVVTTRYDRGNRQRDRIDDSDAIIILDHPENTSEAWTAAQWPTEPDEFVASWSTITTAMHWAAYLGAANVILVGHDCGHLDDAGRVPGYRESADGVDDDDGDQGYWQGFDLQSREVKQQLQERYGCNVVSLDPFINRNAEGHRFRSFAGMLNG